MFQPPKSFQTWKLPKAKICIKPLRNTIFVRDRGPNLNNIGTNKTQKIHLVTSYVEISHHKNRLVWQFFKNFSENETVQSRSTKEQAVFAVDVSSACKQMVQSMEDEKSIHI